MLKSVLSKLIECINTYNDYVLRGLPNVARYYTQKCELLMECLEGAGYTPKLTTEHVEIAEGPYRGASGDVYAGMSFDLPGISADDVDAFKAVGFEWLWASNVMKYEFEKNGNGEKTA